MNNHKNLCQSPHYPYEVIRENIGDFFEQLERRREIEEIVADMPIDRLRELVEADREGRCSISPKLVCMDEVTTPTPEQYRWMMGRFLKGEQDG